MTLLSWDLVSPVEYEAGQELGFNLHFEAPEGISAEEYYVLGGLYDVSVYMPDSIFGVLIPAGANYGVNGSTHMSTWRLEPGQAVDLPCKFAFSRTDLVMALFLMRKVGDEPSLDGDEQIAQVQVQLNAPKTLMEQIPDMISPLIAMMVVVGMMGMMTKGISNKGD